MRFTLFTLFGLVAFATQASYAAPVRVAVDSLVVRAAPLAESVSPIEYQTREHIENADPESREVEVEIREVEVESENTIVARLCAGPLRCRK